MVSKLALKNYREFFVEEFFDYGKDSFLVLLDWKSSLVSSNLCWMKMQGTSFCKWKWAWMECFGSNFALKLAELNFAFGIGKLSFALKIFLLKIGELEFSGLEAWAIEACSAIVVYS
jgi:hypothetical protein